MKSLVSVVMGLAALGVVACGPPATAVFDGYGYKHETYGYRLLNQAQKEQLLPPEWSLDNLYLTKSKNLEQKHTPDYMATFKFDTDGDGATDKDESGFLYDLRFKHAQRDAVIWMRTLPISTDLRQKDLRVLVQRYVDEVSGAGFEAVQLGPNSIVIREKRYAASVLTRGAFTVARQDAFETTFDVANVDEVAINPNARKTRVRIALIRTPFTYTARKPSKAQFPVLMLVGYANLPEDFAKDEPAFNGVLSRIQIGAEVGVTPTKLEQLAPATTPPPVAPASSTAPVAPPAAAATPPSPPSAVAPPAASSAPAPAPPKTP